MTVVLSRTYAEFLFCMTSLSSITFVFLIPESVYPRDGVSPTKPYPCNQAQYKLLKHTAETVSVYTVGKKSRPLPSINFFYPNAESNHQFNYSMDRHEKFEEHEFIRPDENTKFPSQSTNSKHPNANLKNNFQYIPEDSCDSVISLDDPDDDDDDDDTNDSFGRANRSFQGPSPGKKETHRKKFEVPS